jgi:hypothetical protein
MAIRTADNASATRAVAGHGFAGNSKQATGVYSVTTTLLSTDTIRLCRVPKGAVVTGGYLFGSTMDTVSSPGLDIDIGWEANGTDVADTDGFGNFGTLSGAAIAGAKPETGYNYPLGGVLLTTGPKAFAAETIITLTIVASAVTHTTGKIGAVLDYYLP